MPFNDNAAGDFSRFTGTAKPTDLTNTFSYKFFTALDKFKKKTGLPKSLDDAYAQPEGTIKSAIGRGAAMVGQMASDTTKAALFPSVTDPSSIVGKVTSALIGYKNPIERTKQSSAAVGEDIALTQKERQYRPAIESKVLNENPAATPSTVKDEVNYAVAQKLLHDGIFTERPSGIAALFTQGIAQGASLGIFDGYASEAIKMARLMKNPYSSGEVASNIAGNLTGGLVAYGALASKVGGALKTVPQLNELYASHPFLFNAGLQNLGENVIDMNVRRASGQTYTKEDFLFNMGFGATAEAIFAGVHGLSELKLSPIQRQINHETEVFYRETGRYPNFSEELFPRIENKRMAGSNMTFGEGLQAYQSNGEARLAYLKGIDPNTGMPNEGRPGIDYPADLPVQKPAELDMNRIRSEYEHAKFNQIPEDLATRGGPSGALNADEKAVQKAAYEYVIQNKENLYKTFDAIESDTPSATFMAGGTGVGKTHTIKNAGFSDAVAHIGADEFKPMIAEELAPKMGMDPKEFLTKYSEAIHEPSSDTAKELFWRRLSENKSVVYDTNLTGAGAQKRVQSAVESGVPTKIIYVHRNPVESWEKGVLPRQQKIGRSINLEDHIARHTDAPKTFKALHEKFGDVAEFGGFHNKGFGAQPERLTVDQIKNIDYSAADVREAIATGRPDRLTSNAEGKIGQIDTGRVQEGTGRQSSGITGASKVGENTTIDSNRSAEIGFREAAGRDSTDGFVLGADGQPRRVDQVSSVSPQKLLGEQLSPWKTLREKTLLAYKLNAEARGARKGFFTAQRTVKGAQEDLIEYAKMTLGPKDRGKILSLLKNTHDEKSLKRAIAQVDALVEATNHREMVQDIKSVMKQDFLDKLPVAYQKQIVDKVSQFALSKPTQATKDLAAQVEEQLALGTEELAPALLRKASEVRKTALADLDAAELKGLFDNVQATVNRGKNMMLLMRADKEGAVQEAVKKIDGSLDWWTKNRANPNSFMKKLWFADLEYTTPDRFFDMLDGFKNYQGTMYNTFKMPVDEAMSNFIREQDNIVKETSQAINLNKVSKESMERIGTYGLWQRSDAGRFIGREKLRLRGIEEPPVLSEEEMKIYDFMRKKYDEIYPKVEKTLADSENRQLGAGVENYWPMITDYDAGKSVKQIVRENSFGLSRDTEAGFTMKAQGGKQIVELNAAKAFTKHVQDSLYFVHLQPVLDRLNAIVDFKIPAGLEGAGTQLLHEKLGEQGTEYLLRYLNTVATNGAPGGSTSDWMNALHVIRNNTSLATMGGNVSTTLKQPLSILNAAAYVQPQNLLASMVRIGSVPFEKSNGAIKFIMDNSAELRHRNAGEYALYELARDGTWLEKKPYIGKLASGAKELGFFLLKKLDALSAMSVWDAAYKDAIKSMDHQQAVFKADRIVRLTQASGMAKDMPFVMQRGELARTLHQFQTFVINDWNLIKHDIIAAGLIHGGGEKTAAKQWGRRAQALTAMTFMMTAAMLDDLISAGGDWEKARQGGLVGDFAQKVPLLGRAIDISKYGGTSVPAIDTVSKGIQSGLSLAGGNLTDNEKEKQMIQLGQSVGAGFGVPFSGQFAKSARAARRARMDAESAGGGKFDNVDFSQFSSGRNFGSSGNFSSFGSF